jgi:hypothetical protein
MKRLITMLLLVALAIPATAFAAISNQGGGTTIADGKATLVSNVAGESSYISFDDLNGQPVANLTELSADVVSGTGWGGGSPRFAVRVSGTGVEDKRISVYLGDGPNFTTGNTGDTGNLLADETRVDSSQLNAYGGTFYDTWAGAKAAAAMGGYTTISNIALVVDGSWLASQTFVFDAVSINGTVNPFGPVGPVGPVCEETGFYRDSHELTAALINPTAPVMGEVDATGCDIGVYYGPGTTGSVTTADISGALYYGVVANAAAVNVSDSKIHDIGDKPFNGMQRGVGVFYTTLDQTNDSLYLNGEPYVTTGTAATGTLSDNVIAAYQKNGVAVNGPGAKAALERNTVTGFGEIDFIAQNGIQISRGASARVTDNIVSGNSYTPKSYAACGLLIYKAGGVSASKSGMSFIKSENDITNNETDICNYGKGGNFNA